MKTVKKIVKIIGVLFLVGIVILGVLYVVYDQPLPEGEAGPQADALAEKMLKAVNFEAYQETRYLEWSFAGGSHQYQWDKVKGTVQVTWDTYRIHLNLNNSNHSQVFDDESKLEGDKKAKLIKKATDYFNNDSFWLVAPFKVFDQGTKRSIVVHEDGSNGLLVTYSSGGTTPGDSYLWKLQPNGFPES